MAKAMRKTRKLAKSVTKSSVRRKIAARAKPRAKAAKKKLAPKKQAFVASHHAPVKASKEGCPQSRLPLRSHSMSDTPLSATGAPK